MTEPNHPEKIDRDYVRLLQMMRRFVKEEFATTIHINQDDVVTQLLHYAGESNNHVLKEMGKELEEFTRHAPPPNSEPAAEEEQHVRYYRGAAIVDDGHGENSPTEQPKEKSRPTRVYRGRVVNN